MYKANITPYTLALTGGLQWDSCDICGHTVHPKPEGIAYKLSPEILLKIILSMTSLMIQTFFAALQQNEE